MIIISDTSPITNLYQVGQLSLLQQLYGRVIIPPAVWDELSSLTEQAKLLEDEPWLEVVAPTDMKRLSLLSDQLDPGEAEAIVLAFELEADYLLIDEQTGRKVAQEQGLRITGVLGLLLQAKKQNLIQSVKPLIDRLVQEVGFRIHPDLVKRVLELAGEG